MSEHLDERVLHSTLRIAAAAQLGLLKLEKYREIAYKNELYLIANGGFPLYSLWM
jgi:hypothetical protein